MQEINLRSVSYIDRFSGLREINGVSRLDITPSGALYLIFDESDAGGNAGLIIAPGDWHDVNLNIYEI